MLTGFNTDVPYKDKVFHVQTEDKGRNNPIIETLIYLGGEIIEARRSSYQEIIENRGFQPPLIYKLMETQHKRAIADIRSGYFDKPQETKAPLDDIIDGKKSLDEVILEYLETQARQEPIVFVFEGELIFYEGEKVAVPIKVISERTRMPVAGCKVVVKILSTRRPAMVVFEAETDENGETVANFLIPKLDQGMAAIVFQGFHGTQTVEDKCLVMRRLGERT